MYEKVVQNFMGCLVRESLEVVFGYPGGATASIRHVEYPVHHVLLRHEQLGALADGYAAPGEFLWHGHLRPGATNLVTAFTP